MEVDHRGRGARQVHPESEPARIADGKPEVGSPIGSSPHKSTIDAQKARRRHEHVHEVVPHQPHQSISVNGTKDVGLLQLIVPKLLTRNQGGQLREGSTSHH